MKIPEITPLIITFNEEANIRRNLERLRWATQVVVVDSGSSDGTLQICAGYANVRVLHRAFDSFADQCNYGLAQITTPWVLSMDADYIVPENFPAILQGLDPAAGTAGFRFPFRYCIQGHPLRTCLYPPRTVLYRAANGHYENDGHGHRLNIKGLIVDSRPPIDHDDRKPLSRWLDSQRKYALLEAEKMSGLPAVPKGIPDRLRRMIWLAAPAAFLYTLLVKGLFLDGWPGLFYVLQRTYAELLLSLVMLDRKIRNTGNR
jgi:glycosyltransferase involved in cell wall biosynthesis